MGNWKYKWWWNILFYWCLWWQADNQPTVPLHFASINIYLNDILMWETSSRCFQSTKERYFYKLQYSPVNNLLKTFKISSLEATSPSEAWLVGIVLICISYDELKEGEGCAVYVTPPPLPLHNKHSCQLLLTWILTKTKNKSGDWSWSFSGYFH